MIRVAIDWSSVSDTDVIDLAGESAHLEDAGGYLTIHGDEDSLYVNLSQTDSVRVIGVAAA